MHVVLIDVVDDFRNCNLIQYIVVVGLSEKCKVPYLKVLEKKSSQERIWNPNHANFGAGHFHRSRQSITCLIKKADTKYGKMNNRQCFDLHLP